VAVAVIDCAPAWCNHRGFPRRRNHRGRLEWYQSGQNAVGWETRWQQLRW